MRNVVVWVDQRCYLRGGITVIVDLRKPLGCVQLGAGCGWKWGIPQGKLLHSYWTWPMYDGDLPKMVILHRFCMFTTNIPQKIILLNWKMIINHWILRYLLRQIHIFGNLSNNPCDLPVNAEKTDWRMLAYWISLPNKTILQLWPFTSYKYL